MERPHSPVLLTASREKLLEECIRLYNENEKLKEEIQKLKEKLLPDQKVNKIKREKESKSKSKPPSQWGRKPGHPGATRPKPDYIDREVCQTLSTCPKCSRHLGDPFEVVEHVQEDIVPSRLAATKYLRSRYWCRDCEKIIEAPYAPDEVPHGYLGPVTLITMAILKYHHGLPGNKIRELLQGLCGLKVTEGAITQALQRIALWLKVETGDVLKALRESPYVHMDETGWKVNGKNHWLWAAVNNRLAYYQIAPSRGSKIARSILGELFKGILITDFFSAYNKLTHNQQKCLVHLLRELKECKARDAPQDYLGPYRKLRRLIRDALRLAEQRSEIRPLVFARRKERIEQRLLEFGCGVYSNKDWKRLSKRVLKHHKQILAFLDVAGLPSNNNAAERAIRPHVIIRNRSFQNRTQEGAQAHSTLTSLLASLKLQDRNQLAELQKAYLWHRQGNQKPILFAQA